MNDLFSDSINQLNKLSIRKMQFQVTEIFFDVDDDDFTLEEYNELVQETVGHIWEANDEDDLVEEITSATGWCIKSIDYRHILN